MAEAIEEKEATIWEHIEELVVRLRRIIFALLITSTILSVLPADPHAGLTGYKPLVAELPKLIFEHVVPPVVEGFDGRVYRVLPIASGSFESIEVLALAIFLLGLIGASPVIAKEIWEYVEPALYPHEKQFAKRFIALFILAFAFGVFFGIYIVAPLIELLVLKLYPLYIPETYKDTWTALSPVPPAGNTTVALTLIVLPFGPILARVMALPVPAAGLGAYHGKLALIPLRVSIGEVVSFALKMGVTFGVLFELPIVIYLLLSRGILDPDMFNATTMKYIFIGTMVLGAVISPDPSGVGMLLIGLSLYLPTHIAVYLGKKRALERKLIEEAEAVAATP